jgi:SulP family sulfate permease
MTTDDSGAKSPFRFDRMELAGSLGDLGTLIPIAVGLIVFNKLSPTSVLLWVGLFYLLAGIYYRLPIPVQPLKVVGALAIAAPDKITEPVIAAAGIVFGVLLLALSLSGAMQSISKLFTKPVIRGIQLGLGLILMRKGFRLMTEAKVLVDGADVMLGPVPVNLILGVAVFAVVLVLLNNQKLPAALVAVAAGIVAGVCFGGLSGHSFVLGPEPVRVLVPGLMADSSLGFIQLTSFPTWEQFTTAIVLLVIPQVPLTIGNAAIGTADTCCSLFPGQPELKRATPGHFALGLINLPAGFMAAMPMCHGAGGLAAHHRFGARTGGSNLMIGAAFIVIALLLGKVSLALITMVPQAVLGVLLAFAGIELALLIRDVNERKDLFVVALVAGIGVAATNMAYAFAAGIAAEQLIKRLNIKI